MLRGRRPKSPNLCTREPGAEKGNEDRDLGWLVLRRVVEVGPPMKVMRSPKKNRWWKAIGLGFLILLGVLGTIHGLSNAPVQLVGELVTRVPTNQEAVALTFDDGPTSEGTRAILEILVRGSKRATARF